MSHLSVGQSSRYLPGERRCHGLHYDGHAYATAVLGVTEPSDFRGGLYLQPKGLDSRRYCDLQVGDLLLHRFDLAHGVEVLSGQRFSVIFWFKDCEESVLQGTTPWYERMAVSRGPGAVDACYNLGVQYELGLHGKAMDLSKAKSFYRRAAEAGHAFAQNNLGLLEPLEAERWLREAAAKGHGTAKMNLAMWLLERDASEALRWMRLGMVKPCKTRQNTVKPCETM